MKYIILVGDGMPDTPLPELGGRTAIEAANTPNMDAIAKNGALGLANFVPDSMKPGSDVANLALFGYNPIKYYHGRGPLEAASMGVELNDEDVAFRCNLVTLKDGLMDDYSAGHITTPEARKIIAELNSKNPFKNVKFHAGVSYRHLCVIKNGPRRCQCSAPHDITGRKADKYQPKGQGAELLKEIMEWSLGVLEKSPVNKKRAAEGKKTVTSAWLWGQGSRPSMPKYQEKFGLTGSVITAVDLIKGIGVYAGLDVINVPGATGYLDTNFKGKAEYALKSLRVKDFVFIHVEAPDEAGHNGDIKGKIKAIEDFDALTVGTVLKGAEKLKDFRILVTADHFTPLSIKTHARGAVPFAAMGTGIKASGAKGFSEKTAAAAALSFDKGHTLIAKFIDKAPW